MACGLKIRDMLEVGERAAAATDGKAVSHEPSHAMASTVNDKASNLMSLPAYAGI